MLVLACLLSGTGVPLRIRPLSTALLSENSSIFPSVALTERQFAGEQVFLATHQGEKGSRCSAGRVIRSIRDCRVYAEFLASVVANRTDTAEYFQRLIHIDPSEPFSAVPPANKSRSMLASGCILAPFRNENKIFFNPSPNLVLRTDNDSLPICFDDPVAALDYDPMENCSSKVDSCTQDPQVAFYCVKSCWMGAVSTTTTVPPCFGACSEAPQTCAALHQFVSATSSSRCAQCTSEQVLAAASALRCNNFTMAGVGIGNGADNVSNDSELEDGSPSHVRAFAPRAQTPQHQHIRAVV